MTTKILYGDDNEQSRKSLAKALKLRGLEADLASTPQEFLEKARANQYHALITDLEYTEGGREGYEVLREIKDLPTLKILYTGVSGFEYEAEAYMNGADLAVLRKDSSALMKMLDEKLNLKVNMENELRWDIEKEEVERKLEELKDNREKMSYLTSRYLRHFRPYSRKLTEDAMKLVTSELERLDKSGGEEKYGK